jgi:hypothetical protein
MLAREIVYQYTSINRVFGLLYFSKETGVPNLVWLFKTKRHESIFDLLTTPGPCSGK